MIRFIIIGAIIAFLPFLICVTGRGGVWKFLCLLCCILALVGSVSIIGGVVAWILAWVFAAVALINLTRLVVRATLQAGHDEAFIVISGHHVQVAQDNPDKVVGLVAVTLGANYSARLLRLPGPTTGRCLGLR